MHKYDEAYYEKMIGSLGMFKKGKKVEPAKKPAEPVVKPAVKPVVKPVAKVESKPAAAPKAKIIRIPFEKRMKSAEKELKVHYNELKSDILAYGVKSRVSNSGDTFRLHTRTYVKITIAGKALKLYFALDPKDYADSKMPLADVSHKGIYVEIPLVFKVKSELSMRRAKQLVADAMAKGGLVQGEVKPHDWVKEL